MGELRGTEPDRPDAGVSETAVRPVDWSSEADRRRIGAEISRLTALGDERAADRSKRVYDPLAHVEARPERSPGPVGEARIRAVDAADAVAAERAERPSWTLDRPVTEDRTARDVLRSYCGGDLSDAEALSLAEYIADNKAAKPILGVVENADPMVQKCYVDQVLAGGHHAERHDSWRDDLVQAERARLRLDAAHDTEDLPFWRGADALEGVDRFHFCAPHATRIHDPVAFTVATARIMEHPDVKAALSEPFDPTHVPSRIGVTIEDTLGSDGHLACSGFRLAGDDIDQAKEERRDFMQAVRSEMTKDPCPDPAGEHQRAAEKVHREQGRPVPEVEAIPSFDGGTIQVTFKRMADMSGYEISTLFPTPPGNEETL